MKLSLAVLAMLPWPAEALQSVTLGWYPSASPNVAGYNVRYGFASGKYTIKVPAGTNVSATVSNLVEGTTYYFVVTVHDASGVESLPSNEVAYTVPGIAPPGTPWIQSVPASGGAVLKWLPSVSPNAAGYDVYYASTNGSLPQLVFSGNTNQVALSDLTLATNGNFMVTAYDSSGQQSTNTAEIAGGVVLNSAPVLRLQQASAAGQSEVFSVTASGAIPPSWVLEGSSDLRNWGMLASGSNSAVNVTVVVTPQASLFFRLNSPLPGVRLQAQQAPGAFPDSFCCSATGAVLPAWTLQASADLRVWNDLASATGADLKVAIVSAWRKSLFFRLQSR